MDAQEDTQSAHARFEAMYRGEAGVVLMFATHRVGRAAADDIVADTFAVAWSKLGEVPSPPRAWLLVTARKIISNYLSFGITMQRGSTMWLRGLRCGASCSKPLLNSANTVEKP
jgi:hypothetical protein